ncbi:hypothetical protein M427DRAFT_434729 [Gonapodya prolifera JEL478]|uniref:Uncharacterized protein n=1 Tax=Gonapodya prolifera (strain JEL478) TaxID=1344416 RepID=A0A139A3Y1_GONPJ|nr:hypothetical protein M427DRAFT_434729 [Gonapodya prolifera JEL478]|eukprot:KXS11501.1 hypothetical protein M427DRAFT_434729 [Gonapodya prolifera JEL478]
MSESNGRKSTARARQTTHTSASLLYPASNASSDSSAMSRVRPASDVPQPGQVTFNLLALPNEIIYRIGLFCSDNRLALPSSALNRRLSVAKIHFSRKSPQRRIIPRKRRVSRTFVQIRGHEKLQGDPCDAGAGSISWRPPGCSIPHTRWRLCVVWKKLWCYLPSDRAEALAGGAAPLEPRGICRKVRFG